MPFCPQPLFAARALILAACLSLYALPLWSQVAAQADAAKVSKKDAPKPEKTDAEELRALLTGVDNLWFSSKDTADMTMEVKSSHYERTLKLTYWSAGVDQAMVKINEPPSEQGTVTLRLGNDIYNYLPKVDRTVKVSAALRGFGWMGSHFTNDDLVHSAYLGRDYDGTIVDSKKHGTTTIWTVDLTPKKSAQVVWSKIRMVIEKERKLPISQVFYDEKGEKTRTLLFSDLKRLGGRLVPAKISVKPEGLPDEHTDLTYQAIKHGVKFDADFFTLEHLKSL